jgi:hypothetical protein
MDRVRAFSGDNCTTCCSQVSASRSDRRAPPEGARDGHERRPADDDGDEQMNNSINTTPLVDVMLVLLIIFLITIPVVTQTIKLSCPRKATCPTQTKPENIVLAVNRDGEVFWGTERMPDIEALVTG